MSERAPLRQHAVGRGAVPPAPPRAPEGARRVAAIDIGSNSIRQIVADVSPDGTIRVIDEMKEAPRLGAGLGRDRNRGDEGEEDRPRLADASMARAIDAVERMSTLARQLGAQRIEAVTTSAVREAANGDDFVQRLRAACDVPVRVLTGEEEARLSFRSALAHFDLGEGRAVTVDIGGGSMEVALSADGLLERLESFPLGALRMTERFLEKGTKRSAVAELRKAVRAELRGRLPYRAWRGAMCIGSGGTFTNLGGIFLARQGVHTARTVQGTRIARRDVEQILDALAEMSPAERAVVPGLTPARADIIVAGIAVAAEAMAKFECRELTISAYGIREGLVLEIARVRPTVADPGDARARSVRDFAERSHFEAPHGEQVQRLALQLFDAIGERLGCAAGDREILADAALLHDVGYHIGYEKHHKHSYHLILHAELLGMTPEEQVLVANVARYHRGKPPKRKHRNFGVLDKALRDRIERIAAILRVADGFDRGHVGAVERIRTRWSEQALRLTPLPAHEAAPLRLELWGAARKSELLEKVAGVPVEIVAPDGTVLERD